MAVLDAFRRAVATRAAAAVGSGPARLITIPFSHYCEKARWALDRAGVAYVEEPWLPVLSWSASLRAGGRRTVPVLVTADGVLPDSTDILRWVDAHAGGDLYPEDVADEVTAIEDDLDRRLGPAARRIAYAELLPHRDAVQALIERAPAGQARIAVPALPVITELIRRGLNINDASVARSQQRVEDALDAVEDRLSDGRPYLTGDRFTAADLTFAALMAPLVMPASYAAYLPPIEVVPPGYLALVARMRGTVGGAFAVRLYDER